MQTPIAVTVTVETFQTEVVDRSQSMPVVVLFWQSKCRPPCRQRPCLKRCWTSTQESLRWFIGRGDRSKLAQRLQVPGLPCIRVVHKGQIVDQLDGPEEQQLRAILDQHTQSLDDAIAGDLQQVLERGDFETAQDLQAAIEEEPTIKACASTLLTCWCARGTRGRSYGSG